MVSYRKGYEKGLWYQIQCLEETIKGYKSRGKDTSKLEATLKAWRKVASREKRENNGV